jgi:nucleoside-diphosphate-sugar epimerase
VHKLNYNCLLENFSQTISAPLPWEHLFGKNILVTGAGGFLASHFVATLAHLNDQKNGPPCRIIGVVRDAKRAMRRLQHLTHREDFDLHVHDIVLPIFLDKKIDIIIHAASQASPIYYQTDPVGTLSANVTGTFNLLNLARSHNTECFLFFSSGAVYGDAPISPTTEVDYGYLDPATVQACYGEGKRAGETACVAWSHQYGLQTRIVRPGHTYGPGIDLADGRVFSDFVSDILAGRNLVLKSDGLAYRAFCYVADATEGFFTVLLKGENAKPYNVANEFAEVSMRELAEILVTEAFPEKNLGFVIDPARQSATYARSPVLRGTPDTSRLRALGWQPKTGIVEGFRRTVASFSEFS